MKWHPWGPSAFLPLSLVLSTVVVPFQLPHSIWLSPMSPFQEPGPLLEMDWVAPGPVLHAVDPEEARRAPPSPDQFERPIARNREAVLPNPPSGWDLVAQVAAEDSEGQPIVLPPAGHTPQRAFQRQRLAAPGFVLPVVRGT